jgi:hypothetical protein
MAFISRHATTNKDTKIQRIKERGGRKTKSIPLGASLNGRKMNEICVILTPDESEHTAWIDGLIVSSFLGMHDFSGWHRGFPPISLAVGGHTGEWGPSPLIYHLLYYVFMFYDSYLSDQSFFPLMALFLVHIYSAIGFLLCYHV